MCCSTGVGELGGSHSPSVTSSCSLFLFYLPCVVQLALVTLSRIDMTSPCLVDPVCGFVMLNVVVLSSVCCSTGVGDAVQDDMTPLCV